MRTALRISNIDIDTLYVVNNLVRAGHGQMYHEKKEPPKDVKYEEEPIAKNIVVEGSISIAELVKNAEKYHNKTVQIQYC